MSCKYEKIGENKAKFTIEISNEDFLKAEDKAFESKKGKLSIPGFRKGKITKEMACKFYGRNAFLEDAINECINNTYYKEIKTTDLTTLSKPEINVEQYDLDKPFIYTAVAAIVPTIKVANYKGVKIKKTDASATSDDIDRELKKEQEKNARIVGVNRKSKNGDIVSIDFEGFMDGKPFEGGKAEKYQLTLGSKSFIDNFEDQLLDKSAGEEVDVNVHFPENYTEKHLAGKPALFKVKINEVKEKQLPPIDDEFASEVSEFETLEEYKNSIKEKLLKIKEREAEETDKVEILKEIVKNTKIDLADEAIDEELDRMIEENTEHLKHQGLDFVKYLEVMGKTLDDFRKEYRGQAETQLKNSIVLNEIAKLENVEADEEMIEDYMKNLADSYGVTIDKIKKIYDKDAGREYIKKDLKYPAVFKFLYNNAVFE